MVASNAERIFATLWEQYGSIEECDMPELQLEYKFHPTRKWAFDFAHIASKTAIEIDGGVWTKHKQGHTSGKGYTADREKDNAASTLGWLVMRYTPQMIDANPLMCIKQIIDVIESRTEKA